MAHPRIESAVLAISSSLRDMFNRRDTFSDEQRSNYRFEMLPIETKAIHYQFFGTMHLAFQVVHLRQEGVEVYQIRLQQLLQYGIHTT